MFWISDTAMGLELSGIFPLKYQWTKCEQLLPPSRDIMSGTSSTSIAFFISSHSEEHCYIISQLSIIETLPMFSTNISINVIYLCMSIVLEIKYIPSRINMFHYLCTAYVHRYAPWPRDKAICLIDETFLSLRNLRFLCTSKLSHISIEDIISVPLWLRCCRSELRHKNGAIPMLS